MCGEDVTEDGWHSLSCLKSAGRFSWHLKLNAFIEQSLSSINLPSVLDPRQLYRTDQNRQDGLTLVPWHVGKQLLRDVTVVDFLAPCRISAGSDCNRCTAAAETKERKTLRGQTMHSVHCKRISQLAKIRFVAESATLLLFFDLLRCFGFLRQIPKTLYCSKSLQK